MILLVTNNNIMIFRITKKLILFVYILVIILVITNMSNSTNTTCNCTDTESTDDPSDIFLLLIMMAVILYWFISIPIIAIVNQIKKCCANRQNRERDIEVEMKE